MTMTNQDISGGVVHALPEDLRDTLAADAEGARSMGGSDASGAQWMDLLGDLRETTSNQKAARWTGALGTQRRHAPTVLLARLHSPPG